MEEQPGLWAEETEIEAWTDMMAAMPDATRQALGADCRVVGSALSISAKSLPLVTFNRTIGLGSSLAASRRAVASIAAHMRERSAPVAQLQIAPFALTPALQETLAAEGFVAVAAKWAKLGRPAADVPALEHRTEKWAPVFGKGDAKTKSYGKRADSRNRQFAIAGDLAVEPVEPPAAGAFAEVVLRSFGMPTVLKPWLAALVGRPGWHCYAALRGRDIVAGAALHLGADHAWLGIAGTLPEARRLGAQGALMARRIGDAAALGRRWVFTETGILDGDNPSLRNMYRSGFSLLHERTNWVLKG
jgi:hypothetical protein